MGNLLEEILKSATSGDGSILGSIIKKNAANEESTQQTQPSSYQKDANSNFPKTGGKNDPFDIGDELDDIANGRNKGTATPSNEEEGFNIPSMEGINIGDILKKIVLGGSSIPFPTGQQEESENQSSSAPTIDIGDILGKLGIGLGGSGSAGAGGILQTIINIIKMIKSAKGTSRAGLIEEQLSAFMTPEEISQFMTAIDDEQKEEE